MGLSIKKNSMKPFNAEKFTSLYSSNDNTNTFYMVYGSNEYLAQADTHQELIEALIPGYLGLGTSGRYNARTVLLRKVAYLLRVSILSSPAADNLDAVEEEALSLDGIKDWVDFNMKEWSSSLPLIIIETDYYPYTNYTKPVSAFASNGNDDSSNIISLSPASDEDFLLSLHQAGYITVSPLC